jgi:hypothetical protein
MTPLTDILDAVMAELAEALDWPLDAKARWFYQLAELLPDAAVKTLIVDAVPAGILAADEARRIIAALDLEAA